MSAATREPLGIGALLRATIMFFREHARTVISVTLPVVVFVDVVIALGLGELTASYNARLPTADAYIGLAATQLVTVPLITSILARLIVAVRAHRGVSTVEVASEGLDVFVPVLIVVLCYWLAVVLGLFAFILPGVYFLITWYFCVQGVVLERATPLAALAASAQLVRRDWMRCFSVGLVVQLTAAIPQALVVLLFTALAQASNSDAMVVLGTILVNAVTVPFVAIAATLFYLDLRARHGAAGAI